MNEDRFLYQLEQALAFVTGDFLFKEQLGARCFTELEDWINGKRA